MSIDWDKEAKRGFVDNFYLQAVNGLMNIQLRSGRDTENYTLSLPLAKQLAKALMRDIAQIEKQLGVTLDDRLSDEPMPSPLNDLGR